MATLIWLTDVHLNFVEEFQRDQFYNSVRSAGCDGVLLTGDIAEAPSIERTLIELEIELDLPIYFVLGNHDFYYGSIVDVRRRVTELCESNPRLHYLTAGSVVTLTSQIGLLGHDGWADAREGDYEHSYVMMNDYRLIHEFTGVEKTARWQVLKAMGDSATAEVRRQLVRALDRYSSILFATHVPPWREACWHEGQISDDEWAPHFTCKAMGDMLGDVMSDHPNERLTVLCGHTHGKGVSQPLPNIAVYTGGAVYGSPKIVGQIEVDDRIDVSF